MANQYHKSDFPLAVTFNLKRQTATGDQPVTTQYPFCLRFYVQGSGTPETGYLAEFDGQNTTNCTIISPTQVMVYFDRTQMALPAGTLLLEAEFIIADAHYEGDDEMNLKRLYRTGIELTANPDDTTEGELSLTIMNEFLSQELILAAEAKATTAAEAKATTVATATATTVATNVANAKAAEVANTKATEVATTVANATATTVANTKAAEVAAAKTTEIVTPIARQVAEEATSAYVFATDADIDALWS